LINYYALNSIINNLADVFILFRRVT